jgi:hypothetical protein
MSTAFAAVSEPSVATAIVEIIGATTLARVPPPRKRGARAVRQVADALFARRAPAPAAPQSDAAITYSWTYRRWYVWVLVVILFPIGLLFLFVKDKAPITITLEPRNGGTRVRVRGEGPEKVQPAFESMEI